MYKPEQQWITIITSSSNAANGSSKSDTDDFVIDGKKSSDAEAVKPEKAPSLIDTFTSTLDSVNADQLETYRVRGDVGTLIAQKLLRGEKIRVCRNGEPVNFDTDIIDSDEMSMAMPLKKR